MPSEDVRSSLPMAFRAQNLLQRIMIRLNLTMFGNAILGVTGRRSGKHHTVPITVIEWNGDEWVQSPYGETDWVRDLRAAGRCTLTTGFRTRSVQATEVDNDTAAGMLQATVPSYPRTVRRHFEVDDMAPLDHWREEAHNHPVFRIQPV